MINILMIGTFLSQKSGSVSISEKLTNQLNNYGIKFRLVSSRRSKIPRLIEIIFYTLISKYNKIHIDTFSGQAFRIVEVSTFLARLRRNKPILTLHGGALPEFYLDHPKRVKKAFLKASCLQSPSLYLIDFFKNQGLQVHYMPNGLNLDVFRYSRDKTIECSLLWIRAFDDIYNPDLAIRTLFEVKHYFPSASLTMIGPDKGRLRSTICLINELGINDSVRIMGPVPNDQLIDYYHTHKVFLNTTSFESFGMAVVEAAACGIPVVSANVGEIPYLWKNEENMVIIESMKPEDFSAAVVKLLVDAELYNKISRNARLRAEQFDWRLIKDRWLELLKGEKQKC